MVLPLVAAGMGMAAAGGAMGLSGAFKKPKKIDISQQLSRLQDTYAQNHIQNDDLKKSLDPLTTNYKADMQAALAGQKADFGANKSEYMGATDDNIKTATTAARNNLYGNTFNGLPDALGAIREASAAGGGLQTGSYQKAVNDIGRTSAQTLAEGENNIAMKGADMKQGAHENVFNAFNSLSGRMSEQQMQGLTKVMDTGREDLVRQYTTSMGLNEQESQGIIDLLNFQQSGDMASSSASDANRMALVTALMGGGGKLMGSGGK